MNMSRNLTASSCKSRRFVSSPFSFQWAFLFIPTVACFLPFVSRLLFFFCVLQYGFVVAIYQLLDVGKAAVAEFQGVSVEYFSQPMACRERSVDEADELSFDVSFDVSVIWWIEPYNISSSLAFLR